MRSDVLDLNNERRSDRTMGARFSRNELKDVKRRYEVLIAKIIIFAKIVLASLSSFILDVEGMCCGSLLQVALS